MKKTTTKFTGQVVTFHTSLPFDTVIARLNQAINKAGSQSFLTKFIEKVRKKQDIEGFIEENVGENGFLYFQDLYHNNWIDLLQAGPAPRAVVYTIGNPFIAITMLSLDIRAGYQIPPRLLVFEGTTGVRRKGRVPEPGTTILYHLPSSVMDYLDENGSKEELRKRMEGLDDKLEAMLTQVMDERIPSKL